MKFLNKFSVLLLVVFFSFQACEQEEIIQAEAETFKSIDQLPTDDRFVDMVIESINITAKANPDQLERAQELINQEYRSAEDQSEIAEIMGFESWDALTTYSQNQQEVLKVLNAEYNLEAYEADEIKEYSRQVYDYIMENRAVARDDVIGGLGVAGGVGGPIDPCIAACNLDLAICLIANGIGHVIGSVECLFSPLPLLCDILNTIDSIVFGIECFTTHAACVAAC